MTVKTVKKPVRRVSRTRKSDPITVRLSPELAQWLDEYTFDHGLMKTEVITEALSRFRQTNKRLHNDKKKIILGAIKGAEDGAGQSE